MKQETVRLAVAVLFCNKAEQTIECLECLRRVPVFVLDNGSHPDAKQIYKDYISGRKHGLGGKLTTITLEENKGVAYGRNRLLQAIEDEGYTHVLFLDNDITIKQENWLTLLKQAIKNNPDVDAIQPTLVQAGYGVVPPLIIGIENGVLGYRRAVEGLGNLLRGGAVCINIDVYKRIGYYDENFFVGYEDNELCIRATTIGRPLKVKTIDEITLVHEHKKSNHPYDNDYLRIRYGKEQMEASKSYFMKLYGMEIRENPVKWGENKIKELDSKNAPKTNDSRNKVLLYAPSQDKIGGIETFNANFCKRLAKYYDVTFLVDKGDTERLKEMAKHCKVEFNKGQTYEVDTCIFTTAWGKRPTGNVKAKQYIQMIHGDYEWLYKTQAWKYEKLPQVTLHVAVGQNVANKFKKMTGYDAVVIPNLLDDVHPKKLLKLISVTRLGKEKGLERMYTMAKRLKEVSIPFLWLIYGDGKNELYNRQVKDMFKDIREVVFMGASTNTTDVVADADYLVALSDSEGFSYSTYEALQVGTPCIVTDYPSAKEQIQDGVNGFIVDMDLKKLDVQKIYETNLKGFAFKELATEQEWIALLGKPNETPSDVGVTITNVVVRAERGYTDILLNRSVRRGEILEVSEERANELVVKQLVKIVTG